MPLRDIETFGRRPREALMWAPRALDVARIAAVCRVAGTRVADVGAGTGLLARLLADAGVRVDASDPTPPARQRGEVQQKAAHELQGPYDAVIVSWMEAGQDYRAPIARLAPVIVNAYDVEGGCGVMGAVDFAPFGFLEAASWRTASFEDVEFALDRKGRGLKRPGFPGNRVDVLTREPALVDQLRRAVADATPSGRLRWEDEMDALGL